MKIQFCGAAQEVTGSAHLLTLDDGFKILLECGLYQGKDESMGHFNEEWLFDPREVDCMILSHAHIDHSGRIPKLVKDGFRGDIHCTHATRSLCAIMLLDSARIQESDAAYHNKQARKQGRKGQLREPLYTPEHVEKAMRLFEGHGYGRWFRIHPRVEVFFTDAGHILGSASVTLRIQEGGREVLFGFTGDIGRPNRPIIRDPQPMPEVDFLLCEATYGNREHEEEAYEISHFKEVIMETCVESRGKLIIPAFSIGRTQEIVHVLDRLESSGELPEHIQVYVDSPLAVNATAIFGAHPECYDQELNEYLLTDDNPFGFNTLTYVRDVELSKKLNHSDEPCIIISSSGMMNAGRVQHHLYHNIEDPRCTFLIVGYCSPDTPGGALRAGAREVKVFHETLPVRARIEVMDSFSGHADRAELLDFLSNQQGRLQRLFLVHGNADSKQGFKAYLHEHGFPQVEIPELGQEYVL